MAKDWTYGEEGTAWPVKRGQIWAVGPHEFVCSDLVKEDRFEQYLAGKAPDLVYSDPPWNKGNVNSFYTKAGLDHIDYEWTEVYRAVLAVSPSVPNYVEGGKREVKHVDPLLPGPVRTRWGITYYRKHPCVLHYSGPTKPPASLVTALEGMDDEDTPYAVLSAYGSSGLVVDPCGGRGLTSRSADKAGWRSISNELNPNRVSVSLDRLSKQMGEQPRRIA